MGFCGERDGRKGIFTNLYDKASSHICEGNVCDHIFMCDGGCALLKVCGGGGGGQGGDLYLPV